MTASEPVLHSPARSKPVSEQIDWATSLSRKDTIVSGLVSGLGSLLAGRKVTVLDGHGRLHANKRVTVSGGTSGDLELTGDAVVLAPGSVPRTLPGFAVDGTTVMTSDELLSIAELPKSAAIIGGGVIGCEFASLLSDLGTQVTILEALPKILPGLAFRRLLPWWVDSLAGRPKGCRSRCPSTSMLARASDTLGIC